MDLAVHHVCGPPAEGIVLFSPLENCGKRLVLPDWDPTVETWAQWRRRTERALEQYRQVVESQIKAQGLELTPERRQQCHFDWLAGDQICGWSQKRIATAAGADRAGVVRAIHKLARFLGLSLRPAGANRSQDVAIIASIFGRIQPS